MVIDPRTISKNLEEETLGTRNQRKNQDYPNHRTTEISYIILKNPEELRRLAVTQTSVTKITPVKTGVKNLLGVE